MAKGRSSSSHQRANQQRIEAGYAVVTGTSVTGATSKADLRASIPQYDESMVKKVPAGPVKKTKK